MNIQEYSHMFNNTARDAGYKFSIEESIHGWELCLENINLHEIDTSGINLSKGKYPTFKNPFGYIYYEPPLITVYGAVISHEEKETCANGLRCTSDVIYHVQGSALGGKIQHIPAHPIEIINIAADFKNLRELWQLDCLVKSILKNKFVNYKKGADIKKLLSTPSTQ